MSPAVSIILPTFNRAAFLPDAFASIEGQTRRDWELIVVDDGSTDETRALVEAWKPRLTGPLKYVSQENRGAYAARNTGLAHARSPFVAFFDSDDLWLPHHLERCLAGFEAAPDVDWIFAACQSVDSSGRIVEQNTFFEPGDRPRPFMRLRDEVRDGLHVIGDSEAVECLLLHGIFCGLQNSVIRAHVFEQERFWEDYRVVEDSLYLLRALIRGMRLAYRTDIHVIYRMHGGNSSASAMGASRQQLRAVCEEKVRGIERLKREVPLSSRQRRALNRNLAREYFWRLGYTCRWQAGELAAGLEAMRAGLRLTPWNPSMIKTFVTCAARSRFRARLAGSR